jgi:putative hydrolase of the HAD superfamily
VIKAVFFDWFNTLARYDPPREELYRQTFQEFGIDLSLKTIYKGLQVGDRFFFAESAKALVRGKTLEERAKYFVCYPKAIAEAAGINLSSENQMRIVQKALRDFTGVFVLFEDVLPLFQQLKNRGLMRGIITNADKNVFSLIEKLGLKPYLDVIVTSEQVGAEKPAAPIFLAALEQAKVKAPEAIYVGDQYQSDVLGARGAGIESLLIDRYDVTPEIQDCPRIRTLSELISYL